MQAANHGDGEGAATAQDVGGAGRASQVGFQMAAGEASAVQVVFEGGQRVWGQDLVMLFLGGLDEYGQDV